MRTPIPHACERSQERWSTGIVSCTIANVLLEIAFGRCQRGAAHGDAMTIVGSERQRASGNSVSVDRSKVVYMNAPLCAGLSSLRKTGWAAALHSALLQPDSLRAPMKSADSRLIQLASFSG